MNLIKDFLNFKIFSHSKMFMNLEKVNELKKTNSKKVHEFEIKLKNLEKFTGFEKSA